MPDDPVSGEFLIESLRAEERRVRRLRQRDSIGYLLVLIAFIPLVIFYFWQIADYGVESMPIIQIVAMAIFFPIILPVTLIGLYKTLKQRPVHPYLLGDIVVVSRSHIEGQEKYLESLLNALDDSMRWSIPGGLEDWKIPVGKKRKGGLLSKTDSFLDRPVTHEGKAFTAVALYVIAGHMDHLIAVLDENGVQVPEVRRALTEFEAQLRRFYEEDREELTRYVNLGLKRRFRSFEETLKEVLPPDPEFLYDYPPEYEQLVYDNREEIEWAHGAAKKLGHEFDFELYMERLRGLDGALRESIPFTVAEMMKYGHEPESTDWHPKRFWWRHEARKCYEEMRNTKPKSR